MADRGELACRSAEAELPVRPSEAGAACGISLERCREILGDLAPKSDAELERLRAALAELAEVVLREMAPTLAGNRPGVAPLLTN